MFKYFSLLLSFFLISSFAQAGETSPCDKNASTTMANCWHKMTNHRKFEYYLYAYAQEDIESVSAMFSNNVLLRDWKISVGGKAEAVRETTKNFKAAESIEIDILRTYEAPNAVVGELKIVVDKKEVLYVTDVVAFDREGKIDSIRAYIGRGD